jgi:hypothetical protein
MGGAVDANGTWTTPLHDGHAALRPAAEAGTRSDRPHPLQVNSMFDEAASGLGGVTLMRIEGLNEDGDETSEGELISVLFRL